MFINLNAVTFVQKKYKKFHHLTFNLTVPAKQRCNLNPFNFSNSINFPWSFHVVNYIYHLKMWLSPSVITYDWMGEVTCFYVTTLKKIIYEFIYINVEVHLEPVLYNSNVIKFKHIYWSQRENEINCIYATENLFIL